MPPLVCSHFSSQFFRTLQQFRESRYLCDVRLIADGEIEFPAHRLVLAVSSPFFSDLFQSRKDAQDVTTVHLRNCSADCVQILLQFLYSGELQLNECDPGKVLSVARACRIGTLEQMLASYTNTVTSPAVSSHDGGGGGVGTDTSPKYVGGSPGCNSPIERVNSATSSAASHTNTARTTANKRKAKSSVGVSSVPSSLSAAEHAPQHQQQQPIKTEPPRKMANKASVQSHQQQHAQNQTPSSLFGSSGASRMDLQPVQAPTSIFMQNLPPLCPIHGVFTCGCPLLAMAAATSNHAGVGDPNMAAAIQQLFFGAAAAAAAAQAAEMKERAESRGNDEDNISAALGYCNNSLPKVARMSGATTKASSNGLTGVVMDAQNGSNRHCQLPTTPAGVQSMANTNSSALGKQQQQAQSLSGNNVTTITSSSQPNGGNQMNNSDSSDKQSADRGPSSMSMVQVPADDKEGWCRNKKYIKKTPQGYQCTVCKKTYGRYNSVSYHVTIYHRNPPIQCDQPGCTFSTREARYIHFHKYYRHDVALPTNIDLESRRCPFCKHVAKSPAMLEKHINRHMPESIRGTRSYYCDLCKKDLASRQALLQHMTVHEKEKRLTCDQCSYRGRTEENLQQHKLFKHGSGDLWCAKFPCDECQFSAPSKSQLAAHQKNVHGKELETDECSPVAGSGETLKRTSSISDTEGADSANENNLTIMSEDDTPNGGRLHGDSDDDMADEHDHGLNEEANANNNDSRHEEGASYGFEFRRPPIGSEAMDKEDENMEHASKTPVDGAEDTRMFASPVGRSTTQFC